MSRLAFHPRARSGPSRDRAFSLVEVVLALAIASFTIISLIGLFALALKTNQESSQTLLAANVVSTVLTESRVSPTNGLSPLPRLDQSASNFILTPFQVTTPIYITGGGQVANNLTNASYGMVYQVQPNAAANSAEVYIMLYWPPQVQPTNSAGKYEISTQIPIPFGS